MPPDRIFSIDLPVRNMQTSVSFNTTVMQPEAWVQADSGSYVTLFFGTIMVRLLRIHGAGSQGLPLPTEPRASIRLHAVVADVAHLRRQLEERGMAATMAHEEEYVKVLVFEDPDGYGWEVIQMGECTDAEEEEAAAA